MFNKNMIDPSRLSGFLRVSRRPAWGFTKSILPLFILWVGLSSFCIRPASENNSLTREGSSSSILFDGARDVFLIRLDHSSYAFGLGADGQFVNLHWGGRIDNIADIPNPPKSLSRHRSGRFEYPVHAEGVRMLPCLKIEKPDMLIHLKLAFDNYQIRDDHLQVVLKDKNYPLNVVLHYQAYPNLDLIDRWVEVKNDGPEDMLVENIFSAICYVPHSHIYRLTHMGGSWGKEWQVSREFLGPGEKVLESRNGVSGPYHVPYFALDQDGLATEKNGNVWFGTLQWSGDWKMIIEQNPYNEVHVSAGYNDFDFSLELGQHKSHNTPVFTMGFTNGGFGEASRILHRYQKKYLFPENMLDAEVPVVYNTYGSLLRKGVNEANVISLIPVAVKTGVEMFIIDDGWQTAIGDWTVDKKKFPRGLQPIIDEVHRSGMKFGLWIEPERVMNDAKLYSEKGEWLFGITERERWGSKAVSSGVIDLSRNDVLEYVFQEIAHLLRENDIDYIKLDFNRFFEVPDLLGHRTMRTKYVQNFYALWDRLQKEFPRVFFENCASGSARPDLKMDDYFARINRSDNQDPVDCIVLQEGFTYLHPPHMAGGAGHISYTSTSLNGRNIYAPLDFMAHIGMMGWLATTLQLDTMTPEELEEIKGYFDLFKKIRHITCHGEIHRIASMREHPYAAFQFVLPDASESLLFVFGHGLQFAESIPDILLESLDPRAIYHTEVYGKQKSVKEVTTPSILGSMSGQALMEIGIPVNLKGDYDSCIFHFKAQDR